MKEFQFPIRYDGYIIIPVKANTLDEASELLIQQTQLLPNPKLDLQKFKELNPTEE